MTVDSVPIAERTVSAKGLLSLALPALGALAAEPLYVLVDTAVVGHLGAVPLAGLALGGVLLSQASVQMTFLSYGTTARAARLHGAGRREDAIAEGVQATWLALAIGVFLLLLGQLVAGPLARALAGTGEQAPAAVRWLRIALFGAPFILVTMAGHGWMRGVQDTRRPLYFVLAGNGLSAIVCPFLVYGIANVVPGFGLVGSAVANVLAQIVSAALFLRALLVEKVPLRLDRARMIAQLTMGRDLFLRGLAFQACFISAAAVAARTSVAAAGAHQIVLQLWSFLALVLDSLAIGAQSLVGAALGAQLEEQARSIARQVTRYGLLFGVLLGMGFASLANILPRAFTSEGAVLGEVSTIWWFFVVLQPICGALFAIDGVLFGAGDAAFLRTATIASAMCGFLPLIWASLAFGWGLVGIWSGLSAFIVLRFVAAMVRLRSGQWAITGAERGHSHRET